MVIKGKIREVTAHGCEVIKRVSESGESLDSFRDLIEWLCDRRLAEHPADSDEPLTAEWLRSVGFKPDNDEDYLWINNGWRSDTLPPFDFRIWGHGRCDLADEDGCILLIPPKTRGDLRRLCRALGIELTEAK